MYERVEHRSAPTDFVELTIGGSGAEMSDWVSPHDLPLRFLDGREGLGEVRIGTKFGDVVLR